MQRPSINVKYTWRELTGEGLKLIERRYSNDMYFDDVYNTEEEAIAGFLSHFENLSYVYPNMVLVKVYGKNHA